MRPIAARVFSPRTAAGAVFGRFARRAGRARCQATDEEVGRALPGDHLVPRPQLRSTRAITIQAPPDRVFPWLAQLGQGRGGFYSYDRLENLVGLDIHSADRIIPELQELKRGDPIAMAPGPTFYGFLVSEVRPPTRLVLEMRIHPFTGRQLEPGAAGPSVHGSWAFVLEPRGDGSTRLIARDRARLRLSFGLSLPYRVALGLIEFVMERRMLFGIRDRAEAVARAASPPDGFSGTAPHPDRQGRRVKPSRPRAPTPPRASGPWRSGWAPRCSASSTASSRSSGAISPRPHR